MEKELESEEREMKNGSLQTFIKYEGELLSFHFLSLTNKALSNGLSKQILEWRWKKGKRTESKLFEMKNAKGRKGKLRSGNDGGEFDKCDERLANACLSGSNHQLLSIDTSRPEYIPPGVKRRMMRGN